jgi:2-methylcitrate dehydratase
VSGFSESDLTPPILDGLGKVLFDGIACLMTGFDSEPARICARMARTTQSDLKSTLLGFGVTTSPELAAFGGACMVRHHDFNDNPHNSDMIPGILAIAEALHSSGSQVLVAITLGYEVIGALAAADAHENEGWDVVYMAPAVALAVGKLMGMNQDQLANALSLALVPNLPLRVTRTGALSMSKGNAGAAGVRNGVIAALMAREGMTGPAQPFEGRCGLWDQVTGPFEELRLPASPNGMMVQRMGYKPFPAESQSLALLEVIPEIRAWTKVDNIASIDIEAYPHTIMEIGDPPKWDPRNPETADHSLPYLIAVALTDGEVWLSSFKPERVLDPALRPLMQKISIRMNPTFVRDFKRITVRTKTGAELKKEVTFYRGHYPRNPMTRQDINAKFDRVCAEVVSDDVKGRIQAAWSDLRSARDISGPIATLAHFGRG